MATPIHGLPTIDFSVTGWSGVYNTFIGLVDNLLHTYLVITLGETVTKHAGLYCHTDGKWYLATGLNGEVCLGTANIAGVADDEIRLQMNGPVVNTAWSWTIGSKNPIWLSPTTPGGFTQVRPAINAGEQLIGYPITATTILLVGPPSELEVLESSSSLSSSSLSSSSSSLSSSSSSVSSSSLSSSSSSLSSSSSSSSSLSFSSSSSSSSSLSSSSSSSSTVL